MLKIYDWKQIPKKLESYGFTISARTILRWRDSGKIEASVIHESEKMVVKYFTDDDIKKIVEYVKIQKEEEKFVSLQDFMGDIL